MAIRTALVVDDSRLARLTLTKLLEKRDIEVTQASSAREAMASLRGTIPDVIMMDVTMPETDGFEATRQITGNPDTKAIPVVMCTAEDTNEARDQAHACGAHGFLTKPASEENISDVLQRLAEQLEASEPAPVEDSVPLTPPATQLASGVDLSEFDSRARAAAESVLRERGGEMFSGLMTDVARRVFESMVPANDSRHESPVPDDFIEQIRAQTIESATAAADETARRVAREEADSAARSFAETTAAEAADNATSSVTELRSELDQRIEGLLGGSELGDRVDKVVRAALEGSGLDREAIVEQAREGVAAVVQREVSLLAASVQDSVDTTAIEATRLEARKALSAARKVLVASVLVFAASVGVAFLL